MEVTVTIDSPLRTRFHVAFPDRYSVSRHSMRSGSGYHTVVFGDIGRIYLNKGSFNILESTLENDRIPGSQQILTFLRLNSVRAYDTQTGPDFRIPGIYADDVIRIIQTAILRP